MLSKNDRNRRDVSTVLNDQHIGFGDNNGTTLDSIKLNRDSLIDEEVANNKYVDYELD